MDVHHVVLLHRFMLLVVRADFLADIWSFLRLKYLITVPWNGRSFQINLPNDITMLQ